MNDKKLVNAANNFDTLARVGGGFIRAAGIVCIIFAVLVLIFGSAMFDVGSLSLDLDFVKLYLADEFKVVTNWMQVYTVIGLLAGSILCFTVNNAIQHLRHILAPMKEGRPFEKNIPDSLRKIAWSVLAGGAVLQAVAAAERIILTKTYPMEQIFASDAIAKVEYSFSFDFGFVLIFCAIMFLSYIFTYGQKLQQESDETL